MAEVRTDVRARDARISDRKAARLGRLGRFVQEHPASSFFVLAYVLSWLAWLLPTLGFGETIALAGLYAGGFGPAAAAVIITWCSGESVLKWARSIFHWRVQPKWYAVALGLPILLMGLASIAFAIFGLQIDLSLLPGRLPMYLPMLALTALAQGGNEEPGWRGFALPRLEERHVPVVTTLILGAIWAFWHLPVLAANPAETQHGMSLIALMPIVLVTAINIISLSFVYTWIYNSTGSVLLCILLHASANTANGLLIPMPDAALQGDLYQTVLLVTTGINLVVAAALVGLTRGRLGFDAIQKGEINAGQCRS
ncbi:MAG TPA: type II CAAX endopeptidase family protein [Methanotrichaceae archaeon]|nr:type II CAAX endopeptidase family protein [Methanotrichaceae archaeon]